MAKPLPTGEDATQYWNTELDPQQEAEFQAWARKNGYLKDLYDYDMRGAYMSGIRPDAESGHWPDTYKKPNHPTFSDESQYHGSEGYMGGYWDYDETGSETLQPYDPRRDPQLLERAVDEGTQFAGLNRAAAGLGEQTNNAQIVDQLRHPTYQQLAEDRDLRRGRTRMAPRGLGNEGGFGYQTGGRVVRRRKGDVKTRDEIFSGSKPGEDPRGGDLYESQGVDPDSEAAARDPSNAGDPKVWENAWKAYQRRKAAGFPQDQPGPIWDLSRPDDGLWTPQSPMMQEGGAVRGYYRPPEIPEGQTPVPRVRGNLPPLAPSGVERGREVPPVRPMEWYERANPRSEGGGSLKQGPWENPPLPPEGFPSRDIADLAQLRRTNPEYYSDPTVRLPQFQQGGPVRRRQEGRVEGEFDPPQGEESDAYTPEQVEQIEKDLREGKGGTVGVVEDYLFEDEPGRATNLPDKPNIIRKRMADPEHGTWHDDGKFQIYTPHPSFFTQVDPRDLVNHFHQHHPDDHKLDLP